jgi:hypothetical protein
MKQHWSNMIRDMQKSTHSNIGERENGAEQARKKKSGQDPRAFCHFDLP